MDLGFTSDQSMFRESVRTFIGKECPPALMRELDVEGRYPTSIMSKMAGLGWYGAFTPESHGGLGLGPVHLALMIEELARFSPSIASAYYITMWGVLNINLHGSPEQKAHYLPRVAEGRQNFSFSLTEPDSGSDAAALRCRAVLEGDNWVINGQKMFCTQAGAPDNSIILCARTDANSKQGGLSMIFVPTDAPGLRMHKMSTMARRMQGTYELYFDNVRVPRGSVLGEVNRGWEYIVGHLERERMCVAAGAMGHAKQVLNEIVEYVKQRKQFGRTLGDFQAIQHTIADLRVQVDCAELLTYKTAWMLEQGLPCPTEASMAKLHATETLVNCGMQGMRLLGGYGLTEEFPMARAFREGMGAVTGGGTSNIQRNIIARNVLRG
jgi:alkylation response protein AidB-like acyl-CoA dehydrogenase